MKNTITNFLIWAFLFTISHSACAQFSTYSGGDGITATGTAESNAPAEFIRMRITLQAKGATMKEAMNSLTDKKKKATIKLEKLNAIEDSIKFEEVSAGEGSDANSMMIQMRRMIGDDPRIAKMMNTKPPVTVKVDLTADWVLEQENSDGDALIVACAEFKQKISDDDIASAKEEDELSEEQAELAEEMAEMMNDYGGPPSSPAGTPTFYYVRRVSAEDHDKLLGEAFTNAKANAERLAKATQLELGKLKTLASSSGSAYDYPEYYDPYGSRSRPPRGKTLNDGTIEAVGMSPNAIEHSVSLGAVFEIKQ